ncbi:Hypothetical predicted protein [Paramuricea clavata]|uniref:Uncharacterized protein n=1 Tax=Paramuricea clavata TaxID=317549 RepID=A0A7D9D730_PARCT|nr:Hypothetical predicted protein [Paramuricea clavata]
MELQKYFSKGTSNDHDVVSAFVKSLHYEHGLPSQAKQALEQHLTVSSLYSFDAAYIQIFVQNMKLISETKVEKEENLGVLRSQLHDSNDSEVQSSKENAENQEYIRDAFCGKEGEDGYAQFHPQRSDIIDAKTSHTSQEPKSPISVISTGTLDLDPNEKINNFSQSEVIPCDYFGDLVEEELRTTSLNQGDFNSENENSNSDTEDSVTKTIKDSVSESQKSNLLQVCLVSAV